MGETAVTAPQPSIVMILLDALRADCAPGADASPHLASLGLQRPHLPALDSLTRGAFHFTQAMSCAPVTTPCIGSIFTGLLPPEHGVRAFDITSLSTDVRTLAEILAANGWATCAMTDQPPVLQPMGLLRGFQTTVADEHEALAWWDSYAEMPRFLFLHLWDCHKPYGVPFGRAHRANYTDIVRTWQERLRQKGIAEPESVELLDEDEQRRRVYLMQFAWEGALGYRAGLETYLAGLATFDRGRLRDLAGAMQQRRMHDDAITVVLADHGEGRDRPPSARMTHDVSLADDVMHIPLYITLPAGLLPPQLGGGGASIPDQVSQADVMPTLLDLHGLLAERTPPRSSYNGRSLLPLLRGKALPVRPAYAEVSKSNNDPGRPVGQTSGERISTIHARVLRYPERKYRLVGAAEALDAGVLDLPPDEALRLICRRLLGRIETPADAAQLASVLQRRDTRRQQWQALMAQIHNSDEWRMLDKHAVYDLAHDPLEERPIAAAKSSGAASWADYERQIAILDEIDAAQRPGAPLLTNLADEQVILKRLQDLGYVE
jgi:arylsulfatase A-like enzyme